MDEFATIARYLRPLTNARPEALGLMDDAAILTPPPGASLVVTKDMLAENVHFLRADPPAAIAAKALRVNLSDLAAKGARPFGYWLGLGLAGDEDEAWIADFAAGLAADQARYGIDLLGGDTIRTGQGLVVSITAIGTVEGSMTLRSGAKIGDLVFVTGTLGDAVLGLKVQRGELPANPDLAQRYLYPEPRLALGAALRGKVHAGADISDGLVADLGHICAASGVAAVIDVARLPISPAAAGCGLAGDELIKTAATGGDDYELLFTAPPEQEAAILALCQPFAVNITRIGEICAGCGVQLRDAEGDPIAVGAGGYRHF